MPSVQSAFILMQVILGVNGEPREFRNVGEQVDVISDKVRKEEDIPPVNCKVDIHRTLIRLRKFDRGSCVTLEVSKSQLTLKSRAMMVDHVYVNDTLMWPGVRMEFTYDVKDSPVIRLRFPNSKDELTFMVVQRVKAFYSLELYNAWKQSRVNPLPVERGLDRDAGKGLGEDPLRLYRSENNEGYMEFRAGVITLGPRKLMQLRIDEGLPGVVLKVGSACPDTTVNGLLVTKFPLEHVFPLEEQVLGLRVEGVSYTVAVLRQSRGRQDIHRAMGEVERGSKRRRGV